MSVRVNLLPQDVQSRSRANRARIGAAVGAVVLLIVLAGVSFLQRQSIDDAEERLAQAEATNEALRADIAALAPFADLEGRADDALALTGAALGDEVSVAGILQDLSAVMPPTAQFDNIAITLPPGAQAPSPGGDRVIYGRLIASGKVLGGLAPGVERLVIDLDRVAAFDNVYVTTSTVDDEGVSTFTIELELGSEVLTGRYTADGEEAA